MRTMAMLVAVVTVSGCSGSGAQRPDDRSSVRLVSAHVAAPPTIDGKADDAVWRAAAPLELVVRRILPPDTTKSARVWALLVHQPVNGKLYNVVTDMHDIGPMVFGVPLVVIDCYEHAFYVDYKDRKGDYVSPYPKYVDWAEVERRIMALK